jgi:putative ABC transport system permease protein
VSFLSVVFRNLTRRKGRSLLTLAGIAIGAVVIVALVSLAWGFERAWTNLYLARGTDLVVMRAGGLGPVPPAFEAQTLAPLLARPEVAASSGMLSEIAGVETVPAMLVSGWESKTFVWEHLRLVAGRWPASDDEAVVLLGTIAADVLDKAVDASIDIETRTFAVAGIFESPSIAESGTILMTLPQAQRVFGRPGQINFANLALRDDADPGDVAGLRQEIASRFRGFRSFAASEVAAQSGAMPLVRPTMWTLAGVASLLGALAVVNTMLLSVGERVREIGLLRAVGWRQRRIAAMIVLESVMLTTIGGAAGIFFGVVLVTVLERTVWLRGKVEAQVEPSLMAGALIASVLLGVAGGLIPAWRASAMTPSRALRQL